MGDLLSAASLLVTIITVIYGLWYPEIQGAKEKLLPNEKQEVARRRMQKEIQSIINTRALPLAITSCAIVTIFTPDAIRIIWETFNEFWYVGIKAIQGYNAVDSAFVMVVILGWLLSTYLLFQTRALYRHKNSK